MKWQPSSRPMPAVFSLSKIFDSLVTPDKLAALVDAIERRKSIRNIPRDDAFGVAAVLPSPGCEVVVGFEAEIALLQKVVDGYATCWKSAGIKAAKVFYGRMPACKSLKVRLLSLLGRSRRPLVTWVTGDVGVFAESLRLMGLAPSAYNRQPWRVVVEPSRLVLMPTSDSCLDMISFGIALSHFEISRRHNKIAGQLTYDRDARQAVFFVELVSYQNRRMPIISRASAKVRDARSLAFSAP